MQDSIDLVSNGVAGFIRWRLSEGDSCAEAWQHAWRHEHDQENGAPDWRDQCCPDVDYLAHRGFPLAWSERPMSDARWEVIYKAFSVAWNTCRKRAHERIAAAAAGAMDYPFGERDAILATDLAIVRNGAKAEPNRTLDDMLASL